MYCRVLDSKIRKAAKGLQVSGCIDTRRILSLYGNMKDIVFEEDINVSKPRESKNKIPTEG
jgi:hypothetical protein